MADSIGEWDRKFSSESLDYIGRYGSHILGYVQVMDLEQEAALSVAGAIAREETANKELYPYSIWRFLANQLVVARRELEQASPNYSPGVER